MIYSGSMKVNFIIFMVGLKKLTIVLNILPTLFLR